MSATEVIEEIKRLAPEEQEQVLVFLQSARTAKPSADGSVAFAPDAAVEKAAQSVFCEHDELFRRLAQ